MFIKDKIHKLKNLNININSKNNKLFQKKHVWMPVGLFYKKNRSLKPFTEPGAIKKKGINLYPIF